MENKDYQFLYDYIVEFLNSKDKSVSDYRYYLSNRCCSALKMRLRKQWTHISLTNNDRLQFRSYNKQIPITETILRFIFDDICLETDYKK